MKKIDLYEIAIKILGLYLVVLIISQLRDVLIYLAAWTQQKKNPEMFVGFEQTPVFIITVMGFLALVVLSYLLIFRTKPMARLISTKTDFEENIPLLASRKTIYEICLVLLGLITIVSVLPDFIFKLKNHITSVQNNSPTDSYDRTFLVTSGLKMGIGIISIIYSNQLADLIARKDKGKRPKKR